jgi:exodeoxyribonuclease VII small subunit
MVDETRKIEEMSFEEAFARLEAVVKQLEGENLSLDAAVEIFEEGKKLQIVCEKKLSEAKLRIEKVLAQQDGAKFEEFNSNVQEF